ncbi:MAG TPA: tetratricopeptide repeat protein [Candidatus Acidoferrales bacterium]|nr:tetratricopeptide repeat protein [Candidatus Acidoferrales bacterium]
MSARPIIAVVPFGARSSDPRAGAWARQIARRLVERSGDAMEIRPVFLVAMPEETSGEGHLIFGSTPPADLAAQYGVSLGASHVLTGTFRDDAGARRLEAQLVDSGRRTVVADETFTIAAGELQMIEDAVAEWLARSVGAAASPARSVPANEPAYAALLEGMDEEVNATLLRQSDTERSAQALHAAMDRYLESVRSDPDGTAAEERLLVLAAESLERGTVTHEIHALESLAEARPRSWRAHYILGQLRAEAEDGNGAIVAFEHAHSLKLLPDADVVRLAELYANASAPAPALAHLRRVPKTSASYGAAQELTAIIAFQRGELDAGREAFARATEAGTSSWELHASYGAAAHARGELAEAAAHYRDALAAGAPGVVRLNLARVALAAKDRDAALTELDALLDRERTGEVAGHARRLRFGLREPELERDLERSGQAALAGDATAIDAAEATFRRVLAIDDDLWEAHFGLGIVARQRGDAARAQRAFRRVLELWPDQPDALHELGVALLMSDETNAALRALDQAASLRPEDAAYVADAGFAHLRAGNLVSARERLERAAHLDSADPITKSYLGELARVEGEVGKKR